MFEDLLSKLRAQHLHELSECRTKVLDTEGIASIELQPPDLGTPQVSVNLPKASAFRRPHAAQFQEATTGGRRPTGSSVGTPSPSSAQHLGSMQARNSDRSERHTTLHSLHSLVATTVNEEQLDIDEALMIDGTGFHLRKEWQQEPLAGEQAQWASSVHVSMANAYRSTKRLGRLGSRQFSRQIAGRASSYAKEMCKLSKLCPITDRGNFHLVWDVVGIMLICYDLIAIPLQAFPLSRTPLSITMDWMTLTFWTVDIALSFVTSFYEKGHPVLSLRRICWRYLTTWFVVDMCIVVPEWWVALTDADGGNNIAGLGRIFRAIRGFRVLRLLRLFKLQRIKDRFYDSIETEWAFIISTLVRLLVFILLLNHVVACAWYHIGTLGRRGGLPNWIDYATLADEDLDYQYTTSLHWSLTQFTPASMDVSARNVPERVFSIIVLFFAMVVFSSVVASITSSMTSLRNIAGQRMQEFWRLRKYMRQQEISESLRTRILKFLEFQCNQRDKLVQATSINILQLLSEPLQNALANEIHAKYLSTHPFFRYLEESMVVVMHWICKKAVHSQVVGHEDVLFHCGDEAKEMRFVMEGNLEYEIEQEVEEDEGDVVTLKSLLPVDKTEWISEAVLWTLWRHLGMLQAKQPSELLNLKPEKFAEVMRLHPRPWIFARDYARKYIEVLNDPAMHSDIVPKKGDGFYERAVAEAPDAELSPHSRRSVHTLRGDRLLSQEDPMAPRISDIYRGTSKNGSLKGSDSALSGLEEGQGVDVEILRPPSRTVPHKEVPATGITAL